MAVLTLASLRASVRVRGDYQNSRVMTDAILTDFVNAALAELYDLLVQSWEDYYTSSTTLQTTAGQRTVALPAAFYKLLGLDRHVDGPLPAVPGDDPAGARWAALRRENIRERNSYGTTGAPRAYRLVRAGAGGASLSLMPAPDRVYALRLHCVPLFQPLVAGGDTFDMINGYEELPVQMALSRCFQREERPTGEVQAEVARLIDRVTTAAASRDAAEPPYLVDHTRRGWAGDWDEVR